MSACKARLLAVKPWPWACWPYLQLRLCGLVSVFYHGDELSSEHMMKVNRLAVGLVWNPVGVTSWGGNTRKHAIRIALMHVLRSLDPSPSWRWKTRHVHQHLRKAAAMKLAGYAHAVRHGFIGVTSDFRTAKPSANCMYDMIKFHTYSHIISE